MGETFTLEQHLYPTKFILQIVLWTILAFLLAQHMKINLRIFVWFCFIHVTRTFYLIFLQLNTPVPSYTTFSICACVIRSPTRVLPPWGMLESQKICALLLFPLVVFVNGWHRIVRDARSEVETLSWDCSVNLRVVGSRGHSSWIADKLHK